MTPSSDQIRQTYIEFFAKRGHTFVPSSPCVPVDDPTLLFTNAGMNQFKPIFLGTADPSSDLGKLKRAVNSQKCIRAGGKHNDLDDVGRDTYHHTFFEMLGNWSFGDYFKREAVDWSFELLTKVLGMPANRLYATYFGGHLDAGLEPDLETKELWLRHLPASHVLPGNMKDNFWEMGDTGPCGPCTEIHFDRIGPEGRGGRDASKLVNTGDPDVIEIWNNVFIQFNREENGKLRLLPAKHVDTGMGFERLVSCLQGKRSNYDTDVFMPLFAAIQKSTGFARPYGGKLGAADADNADTAYRVIADHIRTLTFAITDGAVPSNEGRGYVLRRILRRAVRYGRQVMGAKPGFFSQLVPAVVERMGGAFPELKKNPQRVIEVLKEEEESFGRTLDRGIKLWWSLAGDALVRTHWAENTEVGSTLLVPAMYGDPDQRLLDDHKRLVSLPLPLPIEASDTLLLLKNLQTIRRIRLDTISAADVRSLVASTPTIRADGAFQLYDTFGFPIDLTQQMAEERGLKVDVAGFEALMEQARERSRAGAKDVAGRGLALDAEAIAKLRHMQVHPTPDQDKFHARDILATVKAIWDGETFEESTRQKGSALRTVGVVLDVTNFYAEKGGQQPDHGRILVSRETRSHAGDKREGGELRVEDVQEYGGYVLHVGHVLRGELRVGDSVHLHVEQSRRSAIASNHTATHLMNLALRQVLGEHVDQKGSLVAPDRLRFDFTHTGPVAGPDLGKAERIVSRAIEQDLTVYADLSPLYVGKQIRGVRAVFGEQYPDPVRVVSIGVPVSDLVTNPGHAAWAEASVEFCGGTHVASTGQITDFAIVAEEAVAKGVRRIVGLTGVPARAAHQAAAGVEQRVKSAGSLSGAALALEVASIGKEIDALTLPVAKKDALRSALAGLQERLKAEQKGAAAARRSEAAGLARSIAEQVQRLGEPVVVSSIDVGGDRDALDQAMKTIRELLPRHAIMLFSTDESDPASPKVAVFASVPPDFIAKGLKAGDWVREAATLLGGKGGGRPDAAQGGGTDVAKMKDAIRAARQRAMHAATAS